MLKYIFNELYRNRRLMSLCVISIAVGCALFTVIISVGLGIKESIMKELIRPVPDTMLKVVEQSVDLGPFQLSAAGLLGGGGLNKRTIERINSVNGVQSIYKKMVLNVPTMATGNFLGRRMRTDLIVEGIDPGLIASEIEKADEFIYKKDKPLPVLVSKRLLDMYNAAIAGGNIPRLTQDIVKGLKFTLIIGKSYLKGSLAISKRKNIPCKIIGLSDHAIVAGMTAPLNFVKEMRKLYNNEDESSFNYNSMLIKVEAPQYIPDVIAEVESAGLQIDQKDKKLAESAGRAASVVLAGASAFGSILLITACIIIGLSFMLIIKFRIRDIAVLRSLGAKPSDIIILILGQAFVVGLLGGIIGTFISLSTTIFLEIIIKSNLDWLSASISMPLWIQFISIPTGLICSVLAAIIPALLSTQTDVVKVLSSP